MGMVNLERLISTRRLHPAVVIAASEKAAKESLQVMPGESWSVTRHANTALMPHCGNFVTLKRCIAMVSAALDEGRTRGYAQQHALLWHIYRVLESAAVSERHDMSYAWPLLGIEDPGSRPRVGLAPIESAGLAAFHRDRLALAAAEENVLKKRSDEETSTQRGKAKAAVKAGAAQGKASPPNGGANQTPQ
eukprot:5881307-Amphidinium_carterae.1